MESALKLIDMACSVTDNPGTLIEAENPFLYVMNLPDPEWEEFLARPVISYIKGAISDASIEYEEDPCVATVMALPSNCNEYENPRIAVMMHRMRFFPGLGLVRRYQGILERPQVHTQIHPFGLGYKPTGKDYAEAVDKQAL